MKKLLLLILGILVLSCNKQDIPNNESTPAKLSYKISLDSLKSQALGLCELFGTSRTKSQNLSVKNIIPIEMIQVSDNSTKSVNADPTSPKIYVINFDNDAGFAILADDRRIGNNIFAYSENGNLDATTINPGVSLFLDDANSYLAASIGGIIPKDGWPDNLPTYTPNMNTIPTNWGSDIIVSGYPKYEWSYYFAPTISSQLSPLIKIRWNQYEPFNLECPIKNGVRTVAGCVAIAVVQIMAYHKQPTIIHHNEKYYFIDWDLAIKGGESNIITSNLPKLIRDFGNRVNMQYNTQAEGGSGAYSADVPELLAGHYGYSECIYQDYNENKILNELSQNRPVYMKGQSSRNGSGHAWILEGFKCVKTKYYGVTDYYDPLTARQYAQRVDAEEHKNDCYLYCNWGWSNNSDGYYLAFYDIKNNNFDCNANLAMITIQK